MGDAEVPMEFIQQSAFEEARFSPDLMPIVGDADQDRTAQ